MGFIKALLGLNLDHCFSLVCVCVCVFVYVGLSPFFLYEFMKNMMCIFCFLLVSLLNNAENDEENPTKNWVFRI